MSVQALKKKWNEDWGDFDYLVKKLLEGDEQFFDPDKSSSKTKQQIMDFVMRYNEKKKIFCTKKDYTFIQIYCLSLFNVFSLTLLLSLNLTYQKGQTKNEDLKKKQSFNALCSILYRNDSA